MYYAMKLETSTKSGGVGIIIIVILTQCTCIVYTRDRKCLFYMFWLNYTKFKFKIKLY